MNRPHRGPRALLPGWLRHYRRDWLRDDLVAGAVLTVMLIPQSMAYASLAGMPPITGLYAAAVSLPIYAWIGTSSHVSFGPFALVALLTATAVEPLAAGDPIRYVALAGALAVLVGALHLLLALVRASAVADLISHPVVVGFTAASGLVIGLSQIRDLTGVDVARSERFLDGLLAAVEAVPRAHAATLVVGLVSIALLLVGKRLAPKAPTALLVVAAGIVAAYALQRAGMPVAVVGDIPSGLPVPRPPAVGLTDIWALLPSASVLAIVCLAGHMSMAKAMAARTRERISARRELLASGVANVASGLVGSSPVSVSFTRTVVVRDAGARTQLAGLVAAGALVLTLLVLTPVLEPLPRAVLAAIVIVAVFGLIDVRAAAGILRVDRADSLVLVATFVATLLLGTELGLAIGVATNVLVHVGNRMRPVVVELGRVEGTLLYRELDRYPVVTSPEGLILRVESALDFLSVERVTEHIHQAVGARPSLRWVVLVASGINGMDTTGLHALSSLQLQLRDGGVWLHLATLRTGQQELIRRAGLWAALVEQTSHPNIPAALRALGVPEDDPVLRPKTAEEAPASLL